MVEEGLEDDHLVTLLEEAHEGGKHAFIRASGDSNFGLGVQGAVEGRRIGFCDCFLQARATLLGAISQDSLYLIPYTSGVIPLLASIGCIPLCPEHREQHRARTEEGCSRRSPGPCLQWVERAMLAQPR